MWHPGFVSLLSLIFLAYVLHSIYSLYQLFYPELCGHNSQQKCLYPKISSDKNGNWPKLQLRIYSSTNSRFSIKAKKIFSIRDFNLEQDFNEIMQIELSKNTLNNGSLWVHCFLLPNEADDEDPTVASWHLIQSEKMTLYLDPQAETFQLVGIGNNSKNDRKHMHINNKILRKEGQSISHLRTTLPLSIVNEALYFDWKSIPAEIAPFMRLDKNRKYLPIFYLDRLSFRFRDLKKIDSNMQFSNFTISYRPISLGKMRLLISVLHSLEHLKNFGFSEKDIDEVKGIFTDTNFFLLALIFFVSAVHILLDILTFKNDIHFWRGRKTTVGLSTQTLLWNCFSQCVTFLYLLEQKTSLLVLIPFSIGMLIEFWKLKKAFKMSFVRMNGRLRVSFGSKNAAELETSHFDAQGMGILAILLLPLLFCGAIYSLAYLPHRSWLGWLLQSLANGVYLFGFLFMLPQLFVNYRLKSVAHLPWRAFMYKAFNTFIDDLFAFIIVMPTAHRVACFRDDLVFIVYLYQRYLYPVDSTRINEFGESFKQDKKLS